MKTTIQNIAGYVLGGVMFVVLLPTIMWLASGIPALEHIGALRASLTGLLMVGGLTLSVWTIVYMKRRGKGNPMDAFGHEVAPRTQHLMTEGPYRINRNPMLTGTRNASAVILAMNTSLIAVAQGGFYRLDLMETNSVIPFPRRTYSHRTRGAHMVCSFGRKTIDTIKGARCL